MNSNEIRQKRIPLADAMGKIVAEGNATGWTPDLRQKFDRLEKEIDSLGQQAEDVQRSEKQRAMDDAKSAGMEEMLWREKQQAKTKNITTHEMRQNALRAWSFGDRPDYIRSEWADHAKAVGIDLRSPELVLNLFPQAPKSASEMRDFVSQNVTYRATTPQSLTAAAGGATVGDDVSLIGNLETALLSYGGQRNVSRIIRTANGADLPLAQADDSTTSAAILTENSTVTIADISFAVKTLKAYKYASYCVSSYELIIDSAIDVAGYLGTQLGERLARGTNAHFTSGDGSSKPTGAVTEAVTSVSGSTAGNVTYSKLVDLAHSVDPLHRASPSFAFQCSDGLLSEIRKVSDSQNRPIWNVSVADSAPDLLLGYPININQDMTSSSTNTGTKIILAGNFDKHVIRDVSSVRLRRLDERLALQDAIGFVAFSRHDSVVLNSTVANASKPIHALTTT